MIKIERNNKDLFLRLLRINKLKSYTEGVLFNENTGKFLYDILEDRIRDINGDGDLNDEGEGKVFGETAIPYTPEGYYYELEVTYSPKFKMDMVLVKDVPHFTGIRMHWGATAKQSHGCILGGIRTAPGVLANNGYTKAMVELLNQYGGKGYLKVM